MRPFGIVMSSPPLNHDLRFFQSIEYLTIQQLIPEFSIKRFISSHSPREYKLTYIFKYAFLLFKVIRRGNPALLFQDFVLTLAGEGFKRWLYLYLHDRITIEANSVYQENADWQ